MGLLEWLGVYFQESEDEEEEGNVPAPSSSGEQEQSDEEDQMSVADTDTVSHFLSSTKSSPLIGNVGLSDWSMLCGSIEAAHESRCMLVSQLTLPDTEQYDTQMDMESERKQ